MPVFLHDDEKERRKAEKARKLQLARDGAGLAARWVQEQRGDSSCGDLGFQNRVDWRTPRDELNKGLVDGFFEELEQYRRENDAAE